MRTYNTYLLRSYDRQNKLLTQGLSTNYANSLPSFLRRVKERYPEVDTVECTVIENYSDSFRTKYIDIFTLWKAEDEAVLV